MPRVDSLTDDEVRIVDAVRNAVSNTTDAHTSAIESGTRHELEEIYYELDAVNPIYWEETLEQIKRRVYNLLH